MCPARLSKDVATFLGYDRVSNTPFSSYTKVYSVICDSGKVSLEHLLLSRNWKKMLSQPTLSPSQDGDGSGGRVADYSPCVEASYTCVQPAFSRT